MWDRITWRLWGRLAHEAFMPGWLGVFTNPFYLVRRALFEYMREFGCRLQGRVLDIGCGSKPYQDLIRATSYVGLEYDSLQSRQSGGADAYYRDNGFPFSDAEFDGILCTEVLEHVFEPQEFLREAARVLKPGGVMILTTPFVWNEHEQPHDFGRYTSFGLRHILEKTGFNVVEQRKTLPDIRALAQIVNACIFTKTRTKSRTLNLLGALFLTGPVTVIALMLKYVLPGLPDFYCDNVVVAQRKG